MNRLLLIDDDQRLGRMLVSYLEGAGFVVEHTIDGKSGLEAARRSPPAAILLDLMLPDIDGLELCRRLRSQGNTPILMLTARGEETDRIVGLELGADDYLAKPFSPRELLARIRAVLRRSQPAVTGLEILRFGRLEIDRERRTALLDGATCDLTAYQFDLLRVLAENAGRILNREQLMERTRGDDGQAFDRSIDVHISRIRAVIEEDPKDPRRILTVRGAGYLFASRQDAG